MGDSGLIGRLIVLQMQLWLVLQMNVFANLAEVLKCYSKSFDWRDQFGDFPHLGSQVRATNDNSIASIYPNHEWLFVVSDIVPSSWKIKRTEINVLFVERARANSLTSGCDFSVCAGELSLLGKLTENRELIFGLWRPGNGTADDGRTTANDFRALICCSGGFLYNGFVKSAKSLSEIAHPNPKSDAKPNDAEMIKFLFSIRNIHKWFWIEKVSNAKLKTLPFLMQSVDHVPNWIGMYRIWVKMLNPIMLSKMFRKIQIPREIVAAIAIYNPRIAATMDSARWCHCLWHVPVDRFNFQMHTSKNSH